MLLSNKNPAMLQSLLHKLKLKPKDRLLTDAIDMATAFTKNKKMANHFTSFAFSYKKEYIE